MPLSNAVSGPGRIINKSVSVRLYTVGEAGAFVKYKETSVSESRAWFCVTRSAAIVQVDANPQPTDQAATHTWSAQVENPLVGSYTVIRVYQKTTTVTV